MRFPGFVGPGYKLRSLDVDCQRTLNLFPEMHEIGNGKDGEVAALHGTPGLLLFSELGAGPVRELYTATNGTLYAVSGNKLYSVASTGVETEIGTLDTTLGPVSFADNGLQMVLVDGTSGYVVTLASNAFAEITDEDFTDKTPPTHVAYLDGYFIFNETGKDNFFISGNDDVTFDSEVSDADSSPDIIVSLIVKDRELWLLGEKSAEIFFNSGESPFPLSRISGATIEIGCAAAFSAAKIGSALFWLSKNEKGQGEVVMAQGQSPKKISTHAIDTAIQSYSDISDARGYTYQDGGHSFYVLNFTIAQATWVYDLSTGLWHERAFTNQGELERHRADCHTFVFGKHLVGDYALGKIYEMSMDVYKDDSSTITRTRTTPHVTSGGRNIFYTSLELDVESGTGLDGTGQGVDPKVMMRFSDDGGHSWSNERWADIGKIGKRRTRALWRKLGRSRDRVFSVTITDPVKVVILGAEIEFMQGGA